MPTPNSLVLRYASLLDTRAGAIVGRRDVVVEDGRIAEGTVNLMAAGERLSPIAFVK